MTPSEHCFSTTLHHCCCSALLTFSLADVCCCFLRFRFVWSMVRFFFLSSLDKWLLSKCVYPQSIWNSINFCSQQHTEDQMRAWAFVCAFAHSDSNSNSLLFSIHHWDTTRCCSSSNSMMIWWSQLQQQTLKPKNFIALTKKANITDYLQFGGILLSTWDVFWKLLTRIQMQTHTTKELWDKLHQHHLWKMKTPRKIERERVTWTK